MKPAIERAARLLTTDSTERRLAGVWVLIALIFGGVAAYLYVVLRLLPEFGIQLIGAGTVFCFLLWLGPRITFPMYFATWFSFGIFLPGIPISLNRVLAVAFLLSWGLWLAARHFRLPNAAAVWLLAAYTLYAVTGGVLGRPTGAPVNIQPVFYLLIAFAVASFFRSPRDMVRLLGVMLVITCAITSIGVLEFFLRRDFFAAYSDTSFYEHNIRINGISRNAIQFAFNAIWMMPWALLLAIEARTVRRRRLAMAALGFLVFASLLTFNRQTPFIVAGVLVVGVALIRYRYRAQLIALMIAAGIVVAPFLIGRVVDRFASLGGEGRPDVSLTVRIDKAEIASKLFQANPWTGIGLDNFRYIWYPSRTIGEQRQIHYDYQSQQFIDLGYLQIVTETGIIGGLMFLALMAMAFLLWVKWFRRAMQLENTFYRNALAVLAMGYAQLLVSMLIQDTFFIPFTYLLFAFLFAFVMMTRREWEREQAERAAESPA